MNTTKHLCLGLIFIVLSLGGYSQNYTVFNAPLTSLPNSADGTYAPFSMNGGTTIYKHTTLSFYIFRALGNLWIIADGPDISANIIVDTKTSTSTTPPLGNWDASAVLDIPLPVSLSSFEGKSLPNGIQLKWITSTETNNKGFEVQHSTDGKYFSEMAWVEGQGTRQEVYEYEYLDQENLQMGIHYYRLKQIDYDASSEYSEIISIENHSPFTTKVFPNPVSAAGQLLHIQSEQTIHLVRVFNQQGSLVKTIDGQNLQGMDLETNFLQPGLYYLDISTASSTNFALPLVVK